MVCPRPLERQRALVGPRLRLGDEHLPHRVAELVGLVGLEGDHGRLAEPAREVAVAPAGGALAELHEEDAVRVHAACSWSSASALRNTPRNSRRPSTRSGAT